MTALPPNGHWEYEPPENDGCFHLLLIALGILSLIGLVVVATR